jgi:hypothetical protein
MFATSSRDKVKEKDEVKEDLVLAASVVDPTWSPKMTYGPTSEVVEKALVVVQEKDMAGSGIQRVEMERP